MARKTTARKTCTDCFRPVVGGIAGTLEADFCFLCCEYASWENTHNDDSHDTEGEDPECMVCQGWDCNAQEVKVEEPKKKGHSNGIAKTNTSHAGCAHESTKSARAACRKKRAADAAK